MESSFYKVRNYLLDLKCFISYESEIEGIIAINNEEDGIINLVFGCADPLLIMEQFLFEVNTINVEVFKSLLVKNRDIVHGAFALDESGTKVIFRDTLQIENLQLNELEGSINSLKLLLSEYSGQIIKFSKL